MRRLIGVLVAACLSVAGLTAQPAQAADTGSITGTVFTQSVGGAKTPAAEGYIYWSHAPTKDGAYSGSTGHRFTGSTFSLTGLKPGFYKFEVAQVFDAAGSSAYQREYYNDAEVVHDATAVQVVGGKASKVTDMVLEPAGQISGRVTDTAGNPIANASVSFQRSAAGGGPGVTTGPDGRYSTTTGFAKGLVKGVYRVSARHDAAPGVTSHEEKYWKNAATYATATPLTVAPGSATANIDFTLAAAPRIQLTVKDPAGKPVPNADVGVWTFSDGEWGPRRAGPNKTDGAGVYHQTVRIGERHKFFFTPPAGVGGATEWYDNAYGEAAAKEVSATSHGQVLSLTIQLGAAPAITSATPKITGTARSGKTLTVAPGTWTPVGVAVRRQWRANGVPIPGATGPTLRLSNAQAGRRITVQVTGSLDGATPVAVTSAATAAVQGVLTSAKVSISGTAKVGKKLRARTGSWGPSPVTSKYKWYRNGRAISGQKKSTYKVRKADVGKRITVRVTRSKSHYVTVSRLSSKTAKVKKK